MIRDTLGREGEKTHQKISLTTSEGIEVTVGVEHPVQVCDLHRRFYPVLMPDLHESF